ncbi:MAG: response regulator [Deltaproteobacteria bacterium RIFOXYD12_FULL_57_12]|nr:MAG: response regulator [Deltaproteobacteria bacterium RIFOXYD12_FULL_57_12]
MKQMKVLLVDDEETFVRTLSERLNMRDLKTDTVYDGEQALDFVDDKEPDVMVLDLKMPGIDGMEVLRRVKERYPAIQVIILTGHGTDLHEDESKRLGVFDYLKKPVDIEILVSRIKAAYQKKIQGTMSAVAFAEAG